MAETFHSKISPGRIKRVSASFASLGVELCFTRKKMSFQTEANVIHHGDSSVLYCASLLRTILASLARANERVHVHIERNFPQASR